MTQFDVRVQCPACGAGFTVPRIRRGSAEACPVCGFRVEVPGGSAYEEGEAQPAATDAAAQPRAAAREAAPSTGRCVVCALQEGRVNPLLAAPLISEAAGVPLAEAKLRVVQGLGVLAEGIPAPQAHRLAELLRAARVPAFALDEARVPRVERELPMIRVYDVRDDALWVQSDAAGTVRPVPWQALAGGFCTKMRVVRGGPPELEVQHRVYYAGNGPVVDRRVYRAARRPPEPAADCTLLVQGNSGRLYSMRFSEREARYAYLGRRQRPSAALNFSLLLADLIARCPHGFFPQSTREVAAGRRHRVARLRTKADYERYLKWVLCCLGQQWHGEAQP